MTNNIDNKHIHSRFLRFVRDNPGRPAIRFRRDGQWQEWSYAQLCGRASQIAVELQTRGVEPGDAIGLMAIRRPDTIASMIAILAVGAHFVPLDPKHPMSRLRDLCEDASIVTTISANGVTPPDLELGGLLELEFVLAPPERTEIEVDGDTALDSDSPAFILFTSGSTGRPKGVIIPHRGVIRTVDNPNFMPVGADTVFLQQAPLCFDGSTFEIWVALLNGGVSVLYPEELLPVRHDLAEIIQATGVTHLFLTTTLFHQIFEGDVNGEGFKGLRHLSVGGEAMSVAHARQAARAIPDTQIINGYGPTENSMISSYFTIPQDLSPELDRVPIGVPVSGTEMVIVDEHLRPVADGDAGELVVLGEGVALGYLNRPKLTRERFVNFDMGDGVLQAGYRTGDRAYRDMNGLFEFMGRFDDQVKIEGHRIEPGEIEAGIERIAGINACRVLPRKGPAGQLRLVAYIVCEEPIEEGELRQALAGEFPAYMIPHFIFFMDSFPINANGKLDTKALPDPFQEATQATAEKFEGSLDIVVSAWTRVLGMRPTALDVNFFDAGGTSFNAIQLHEILCKDFGRTLDPTFIFEYSTISQQSDALQDSGSATDSVADRGARRRAARSARARGRS
jgi:amino acid adenylation domain-containing protein